MTSFPSRAADGGYSRASRREASATTGTSRAAIDMAGTGTSSVASRTQANPRPVGGTRPVATAPAGTVQLREEQQETEHVSGDLRKEDVRVETQGNVDGRDNKSKRKPQ